MAKNNKNNKNNKNKALAELRRRAGIAEDFETGTASAEAKPMSNVAQMIQKLSYMSGQDRFAGELAEAGKVAQNMNSVEMFVRIAQAYIGTKGRVR